ncbi:hypothetical protein JNW89_18430, partial [Micromonospora sp. 4G55]|nr:hypothetical protein [Micromonospora sp. 4G55]
MMKVNSKVLGLIIGVFFISLSLIGCTENAESGGETSIFEIANTEEAVGEKGEEVST